MLRGDFFNTEVYSMHSEQKVMVVKKFARTLKNKIYKNMITIPKNLYPNELTEIAR